MCARCSATSIVSNRFRDERGTGGRVEATHASHQAQQGHLQHGCRCVLIITALGVWFVINVTRAKKQAEEERNTDTHERDRANDTLTECAHRAHICITSQNAPEAAVSTTRCETWIRIKLDPKNPFINSSARTCSKRPASR